MSAMQGPCVHLANKL